jgi:hypothetical protein
MKFQKMGAVALLALSAAMPLRAQEDVDVGVHRRNTGAGTSAAEFLLFGAGARGMALSPAYNAITRDVEALYYNPGALSLLPGTAVGLTIMPYFADTRYLWAGVATPIAGGEYGIGVSIANYGFSEAPVYTEVDQNNTTQLTYNVSQTVIGLSFAHSFIDRFSGGVTLKLISDHLGQTSANGVAFDVGTNYHAELGGRPISMAFVIQNIGGALTASGPGLDFDAFPEASDPSFPERALDPEGARFRASSSPLPAVFKVGTSYDALSTSSSRLTLMGEFNDYYNSTASFGLGSEFAWAPKGGPISAALRGSYAYQPDNSLSGQEEAAFAGATSVKNESLDGLSLGAGMGINIGQAYRAQFDYAWRNMGVLGSRNVFTVGLNWR